MNIKTSLQNLARPSSYLNFRLWNLMGTALVNARVFSLAAVYLLPFSYVVSTALKSEAQLMDRGAAPEWPGEAESFTYGDREYFYYDVPTDRGLQRWVLVKAGQTSSQFIDPANPQAGLITWEGHWQTLSKVYYPYLHFENFLTLWETVNFELMIRNTAFIGIVSGTGAVISSIIVAYGLSRFKIPGEKIILMIVIGTLLIPEKITLIPTYIAYFSFLKWYGTQWPLIVPHLFGSAAFIFLLRQNFKTIPREQDEAAMIDGAGPMQILIHIILPQAMPAVITVSLLHFFFVWNETRMTSLFLGSKPLLQTVAYGIVSYSSLLPVEHILQASVLVVMTVPVIVLFLSQSVFMRQMVVTGLEK
jgi:multiple sugar transport system permease protein